MAGRKRLDVLQERIEWLAASRQDDVLGSWLRTLPDHIFYELARRLDAGETPENLLEEYADGQEDTARRGGALAKPDRHT